MGEWDWLIARMKTDAMDVLTAMVRAGEHEPWLSLPRGYDLNNLRDLIGHLATAALADPPVETELARLVWIAATHGEQRLRSGFPEQLLFTEYHLLRGALWKYVEALRGRHVANRSIVRIDAAITAATSASLLGYHRSALEAKGLWPSAVDAITARMRAGD